MCPLLAEQNTNVALKYAHKGYILESGRVVMDGPAKNRENPDVKEFYLGMSEKVVAHLKKLVPIVVKRSGSKHMTKYYE